MNHPLEGHNNLSLHVKYIDEDNNVHTLSRSDQSQLQEKNLVMFFPHIAGGDEFRGFDKEGYDTYISTEFDLELESNYSVVVPQADIEVEGKGSYIVGYIVEGNNISTYDINNDLKIDDLMDITNENVYIFEINLH